jgi:hypothetical protein
MGKMGFPMTERVLSAHGSRLNQLLPRIARFLLQDCGICREYLRASRNFGKSA